MEFKAKDRRLEGKTLLEQARLAEQFLLDIFVEICEKHNLRYFLAYGTLIGVMRHKGFIPWDDDIDVGMPLADYKRFLKIAPQLLPRNLLLDHMSTVSGTAGCYAKIRDRCSFFCEPTSKVDLPCGIFLDVFPFERLPKLPFALYKKIAGGCAISAWSYRAWLRIEHKNVLSLCRAVAMAFFWLGVHGSLRLFLLAARVFFGSNWKASPENNPAQMSGLDDADLFPLELREFEGRRYQTPHNADKMLTQLYGNWRELPPESERKWHADIICPTTPPRAWWAMPYGG